MRLSKSSILTFLQCPRKYKYQTIDKIKPKKVSIHLIRGREIHKIFEDCLDKDKVLILMNDMNLFEAIGYLISNHPMYKKYKADCDNFLEKFISVIGNLPVGSEIRVHDRNINFSGYIDVVLKDKEGNLLILDYKTGKDHPLSEFYFELAMYAYSYKTLSGEMPSHFGIFFSKSGNLMIEKINKGQVDNALNKLKEARRLIEYNMKLGERSFERNITPLCKWDNKKTGSKGQCDYYDICKPPGK